eukprot:2195438-Rhodomonas_salina.12
MADENCLEHGIGSMEGMLTGAKLVAREIEVEEVATVREDPLPYAASVRIPTAHRSAPNASGAQCCITSH